MSENSPVMNRRLLLSGATFLLAASAAGRFASAAGRASLAGGLMHEAALRGALGADGSVTMPEAAGDGSRRFARVLKEAAARGRPVFLPPGTYRVSGLDLPDNTEINGVPGSTRIEYTGDGALFSAAGARRIRLSGITIDGANRWLADGTGGLLHFIGVERVEIDNCTILGSARNGIHLEGCGGEIRESAVTGAADAGIYAVESHDLAIRDNRIEGCGNGGILVHRYKPGPDGTIVSGNRVTGTLARAGGTGQNGNGINVFRAANVMITNNMVSGSAFSAIRANSASGVQITGNQCLRSGETAIYAEFAFEGAVISANQVDGAANGISVVNFNEGGRLATVSGNVLRNLTAPGPYPAADAGFGIGIAAEADTVISGNVIDTAAKWGLALGWGPYLRNVVATGNMVRAAPVGCAVTVAEGAGSALIAENTFAETKVAGVAGFRWNEQATGELAEGGSTFPHLTVERNRLS